MISKKIKLGSNEFLVIDLNQPLSLDQEVYPGDSKVKRTVFSDIKKTGFHHYIHEIGDHYFHPHGDAPNHQNPDMMDQGFEKFDLDYCFNSAFMIDLSTSENTIEKKGVRFQVKICKSDLVQFEEQFRLKEAVVIRTGYDKWLENNYPHDPKLMPYLTPEAAEYIASFENIKVYATDSLTVDPDGSHIAHQVLKNKFIVESMVHLHHISQENMHQFDLQTSALRIVGATGGPVAAYAIFQE